MNRVTLLQWNMGVFEEGKSLPTEARVTALLGDLLRSRQPGLVALQEAPRASVSAELEASGYEVRTSRQRLVTAWKADQWKAEDEEPIAYARATAVQLYRIAEDDRKRRVTICNVHGRSLDKGSPEETEENLRDFVSELRDLRARSDAPPSAEIIVGDFNLEPHHTVMHTANGFFGNRSFAFVRKRERQRSLGEKARPLYNPSWRIAGREAEPLGTYYNTKGIGAPWFVFDQALFSLDLFDGPIHVNAIVEVAGRRLVSSGVSKPDKKVGSDHLPVVWRIPMRMGRVR